MNRLKSSDRCRVCRRWLQREWEAAQVVAERAELARQMDNGMCDGCQRDRQLAALEYIAAAETVRVVTQMFEAAGQLPPSKQNSVLTPMRDRMRAAEERCVALLMWNPMRDPSPRRFWGNR